MASCPPGPAHSALCLEAAFLLVPGGWGLKGGTGGLVGGHRPGIKHRRGTSGRWWLWRLAAVWSVRVVNWWDSFNSYAINYSTNCPCIFSSFFPPPQLLMFPISGLWIFLRPLIPNSLTYCVSFPFLIPGKMTHSITVKIHPALFIL